MKDNDFSLAEQALSLIEASGDLKSIPFKPTQILNFLLRSIA